MFTRPFFSSKWLIPAQIFLVSGGASIAAFYPPVDGAMALVALDGRDAGRLAQRAIASGGSLLGRGTLSNVLIVQGSRSRLVPTMLANGVLVIAAPKRWCGSESPTG